MSIFKLHTINTAPAHSKPLLQGSQKSWGMIPNLHAVMAEAPGLLQGYQLLHQLFQDSSFDEEELTVVWQTINVEHGCHYCVPAHTAISTTMKVDKAISDALRNEQAMPTEKLQVLHDTTLSLLRKRGHLSDAELTTFYAAGYGQRQLLEIILGLSQKVMSNYVNHIAETPIDAPFQQFPWQKSNNEIEQKS